MVRVRVSRGGNAVGLTSILDPSRSRICFPLRYPNVPVFYAVSFLCRREFCISCGASRPRGTAWAGGGPLSAADVERRASGVIKSRFSSSGYSSYCCRGLVCSSSPLQTRTHLAATARRAAGTNELCRTHSNDSSKANRVSSAWVWRRFELTLGHIACIALMRPVATDGEAWSVCVLVTTAGLRKRQLNRSGTDSRGPKER